MSQETPNCTKCQSKTHVSSTYQDMWFCPSCGHGDYLPKVSPLIDWSEGMGKTRGRFDQTIIIPFEEAQKKVREHKRKRRELFEKAVNAASNKTSQDIAWKSLKNSLRKLISN